MINFVILNKILKVLNIIEQFTYLFYISRFNSVSMTLLINNFVTVALTKFFHLIKLISN
jgi:hypothetical protein